MGMWARFQWSWMCVVIGLLQQDSEILSFLVYNNYFSYKRLLSSKACICSMRLVIVGFYLIGYCYILYGWLLLCSMRLVTAMFCLVGYSFSIWLFSAMFYLGCYCYVLFGWLLLCSISWLLQCSITWLFQCSILLVFAVFYLVGYCYVLLVGYTMFYFVGYCFARIPKRLNFGTVKIILLKRLYEFHMNVWVTWHLVERGRFCQKVRVLKITNLIHSLLRA